MVINYENIKVSDYFQLHKEMIKKYGKNTIVFIQVGGFYELYSTDTDGPNLDEISDKLDVLTTKKNKNKNLSKSNPYMMGFPNHSIGKYIDLMIKEGYLLVIVSQVTQPPNPKRKITQVITPSTYTNNNSSGNYLVSIIIDASKDINNEETVEIGMSAMELSLGDIYYHQGFSKKGDSNYSLDDAYRFIQTFKPSEVVFCNLSKQEYIGKFNIKQIREYLKFPKNTIKLEYPKIKPLKKITFQKRKFTDLFNQNLDLLENINILNLARISLFQMFYYIERINDELIIKMKIPKIFYNENKVYLGNRTLKQLNFSKNDKLYNLINLTRTPMGKRYFELSLENPDADFDIIKQKYSDLQFIKDNPIDLNIFKQMFDLERINRKILLENSVPVDIYKLHSTLLSAKELFTITKHSKLILQINEINIFIEKTFNIDKIKFINTLDIEESFFNPENTDFTDIINTQKKLDSLYLELDNKKTLIENLIDEGKFIKKNQKSILKLDKNLIDGFYYSCTKIRAQAIQKKLQKNKIFDLTFNYQKNTCKIKSQFLNDSFNLKNTYEALLVEHTKKYFLLFLQHLSKNYNNTINTISQKIAYYDFISTGSSLIDSYHYSIPILRKNKDNHSFFRATQLRHPLVEQILDEEYIPQNISLDDSLRGILLFGVNSAGKSTLMKSIGISILLAQIGFPVPAKKFEYYPYQSIFTRISGNDDILKGLSSFMVEIMELNSILKRNNKNTLVIADELCRGTEVDSALYIVATMIEKLAENDCSFITASHLHKLKEFDNIKKLSKVKSFHLKVEYKENKLIYNRKLLPGYGSSYYGIEVAKYIFEDKSIISRIYEISKQFEDMKTSKYNSEIVLEKCSICNSKENLETHHIIFQKDFIDGKNKKKFHLVKNNKSNLVVLCQKCHDEVDRKNIKIKGWKDSKLLYKMK